MLVQASPWPGANQARYFGGGDQPAPVALLTFSGTAVQTPDEQPLGDAHETPLMNDDAFPWLVVIIAAVIVTGLVGGYLLLKGRRPTPPAGAAPASLLQKFLRYRDEQAWAKMYDVLARMPPELAGSLLVQQQYGFALNRDGHGEAAEQVLRELLAEHGPSPETNGLLGRVYKDRWERAHDAGAPAGALLDQAIATYLAGHEAKPSVAYPGLNALTLMEFYAVAPARRVALRQAVGRALAGEEAADYWHHASRLELAVLDADEATARAALSDALAVLRVRWELVTTARNLSLIRKARRQHGRPLPGWQQEIEAALAAGLQE